MAEKLPCKDIVGLTQITGSRLIIYYRRTQKMTMGCSANIKASFITDRASGSACVASKPCWNLEVRKFPPKLLSSIMPVEELID